MTSLTVAPLTSGTKYGVDLSTLVSGLTITGTDIKGTLNYYDGSNWELGTWSEEQKAGNFLPLSLSSDGTITVQVIGGDNGPTQVTDGFCIFRIKSNTTQTIQVKASGGGGAENTKTYSLTGLTLTGAPGA